VTIVHLHSTNTDPVNTYTPIICGSLLAPLDSALPKNLHRSLKFREEKSVSRSSNSQLDRDIRSSHSERKGDTDKDKKKKRDRPASLCKRTSVKRKTSWRAARWSFDEEFFFFLELHSDFFII